jgi:hypothetical protein
MAQENIRCTIFGWSWLHMATGHWARNRRDITDRGMEEPEAKKYCRGGWKSNDGRWIEKTFLWVTYVTRGDTTAGCCGLKRARCLSASHHHGGGR